MKKLDLNTSKDLFELKESLNKVIGKKIAEQKLQEKINSIQNLSFGEYKVLFEDVMPNLSDDVEGKKIIASYVKLLKENKSINLIYKILENKEYSTDDTNALSYALSDILENIDKNLLREGEHKMYEIYKNACSHTNVSTNCETIDKVLNENAKINNAISYLTHKSNKNSIKHLNERISSVKSLNEFINEHKHSNDDTNIIQKPFAETIDDLNNLLENVENDWEREVLKDISLYNMSGRDKSELFETYKTKCIEAIDSFDSDDTTERSRLYGMKQQLSEKVYREESLCDDLLKLAELRKTIIDSNA